MWQSRMGWNMPLCKWHTFWMAPCLICYLIVILFYIERKWLLMRNLAVILPLQSKLFENFQCFNALMKVSKCWKIVGFQKISIRMKNCKHFARPKQRTTLRKLFSLPPPLIPPDKCYCVFETNIFVGRYNKYTDVCFQSASRMQFLCVRKWYSENIFSDTK